MRVLDTYLRQTKNREDEQKKKERERQDFHRLQYNGRSDNKRENIKFSFFFMWMRYQERKSGDNA